MCRAWLGWRNDSLSCYRAASERETFRKVRLDGFEITQKPGVEGTGTDAFDAPPPLVSSSLFAGTTAISAPGSAPSIAPATHRPHPSIPTRVTEAAAANKQPPPLVWHALR